MRNEFWQRDNLIDEVLMWRTHFLGDEKDSRAAPYFLTVLPTDIIAKGPEEKIKEINKFLEER